MAARTRSTSDQFSILPGAFADGHLVNTSVDYTDNHVNGDLHQAFECPETMYNDESDRFIATADTFTDEKALSDSQQAFSEALQEYEKEADPKYKTGIDLKAIHTWDEVIKQVETACEEYKGYGKEGIMTSIRCGLRNFHTAAPAIQAWLKLLPSTSVYGSVVCGGLTIILEAAVRLGQLREDTYLVLDQIPLRVERAAVFMNLYRDTEMKKQAADLYKAILDALQHILGWYKRKAMKFLGSFSKGPAYAITLKAKMKAIEDASQAMEDHAGLNQHKSVHIVRRDTLQTRNQLDNLERTTEELKELALEARNALYAVFRDTEAWQEVAQFWAATREANEQRRASLAQLPLDQQGRNVAARDSLLLSLDYDRSQLARDVEDAIRKIFLIPLTHQDRAIAIIQDPMVEEWMVEPQFGPLLVHANSRRHEPISPASVACAMLVHIFSNTTSDEAAPFITLYWFCGSHIRSPNDGSLKLMRSLICQLLIAGPSEQGFERPKNFDSQDLEDLLDIFTKLLRQLPERTAVVCIIDGISYYEDAHLRENTTKSIRRLIKLSREKVPIFKLLITSPRRTSHIHREPAIAKYIRVVEIPQHVNGAKQGFNHRAMVMETEQKARRLSLKTAEIED